MNFADGCDCEWVGGILVDFIIELVKESNRVLDLFGSCWGVFSTLILSDIKALQMCIDNKLCCSTPNLSRLTKKENKSVEVF